MLDWYLVMDRINTYVGIESPSQVVEKTPTVEAEAISNSKGLKTSDTKPKFTERVKKNLRNPVDATSEGEDNLPRETAELIREAVHAPQQRVQRHYQVSDGSFHRLL